MPPAADPTRETRWAQRIEEGDFPQLCGMFLSKCEPTFENRVIAHRHPDITGPSVFIPAGHQLAVPRAAAPQRSCARRSRPALPCGLPGAGTRLGVVTVPLDCGPLREGRSCWRTESGRKTLEPAPLGGEEEPGRRPALERSTPVLLSSHVRF